ncbi:signal peptidase II [Fictibacillus sp. Mic-4]|uniref:signal peptidase II n=1 Tax=Fictibacillus TaxID=1329200 RepID=UPI00040A316A|nr:signal peptidase II [Fictibacillus gelatini]
MYYYLLAALVLGLDQLSKWWIVKHLEYGETIPVIRHLFYITSQRNRGAAFSILQNQMWFFIIITIIVIIAVMYYMGKVPKNQLLLKIALGLVLGGAIGNFVDRIFRGEVVDFIGVIIVHYYFPVFNIADSALTIGVIFIFIHTYLESKRKKESLHG